MFQTTTSSISTLPRRDSPISMAKVWSRVHTCGIVPARQTMRLVRSETAPSRCHRSGLAIPIAMAHCRGSSPSRHILPPHSTVPIPNLLSGLFAPGQNYKAYYSFVSLHNTSTTHVVKNVYYGMSWLELPTCIIIAALQAGACAGPFAPHVIVDGTAYTYFAAQNSYVCISDLVYPTSVYLNRIQHLSGKVNGTVNAG